MDWMNVLLTISAPWAKAHTISHILLYQFYCSAWGFGHKSPTAHLERSLTSKKLISTILNLSHLQGFPENLLTQWFYLCILYAFLKFVANFESGNFKANCCTAGSLSEISSADHTHYFWLPALACRLQHCPAPAKTWSASTVFVVSWRITNLIVCVFSSWGSMALPVPTSFQAELWNVNNLAHWECTSSSFSSQEPFSSPRAAILIKIRARPTCLQVPAMRTLQVTPDFLNAHLCTTALSDGSDVGTA